ncbi:NEW3 domain-containing protein [Haloarcula marina]|uniref:NEW3 domain-containing protein n=1 Tax=Haloarcula marina TaxID=2961574 RepID=UPI0020B68500|nr:NEW3 domain-containing protein [Halomicroarcula marina]
MSVLLVVLLVSSPVAAVTSVQPVSQSSTAVTAPSSGEVAPSIAYGCQEINGHKYCLKDVWAESGSVQPGETVTIKAVVENQGSKTGSISTYLGVRPPGETKSYPDGAKAYDIRVGEQVTLEYQYQVPESNPTGEYEVTVDVWTGNDAEMFHTSGWQQLFEVTEPTTAARIASIDPDTGTYEPGDSVDTRVTVENTGSTEHTFYVGYSVRGPDGEWWDNGGTTHEPITLDAGARDSVTVEWDVEDSAPSGTYDVVTALYTGQNSDGLLNRIDSDDDTDVFSLAEARTPPSADRDSPAREVTVETDDSVRFTLDATDPDGDLDGVEWYVDGTHMETTRIGGSTDEGEWAGRFDAPGTYYVEGLVFDETGAYSDAVSWSVTVREPTDIDARIRGLDADGGEYTAGDTVETTVYVENTGNTEHTFYVGYSLRGPDGNLWDNDGTTHESVRLTAGERDRRTVEWDVPEQAPAGEYDVVTALYAAESSGKLENRLDSSDESSAVTIAESNTAPRVGRVSPSREQTIEPGDAVQLRMAAADSEDNLDGVEWYVDGNHEATTRLDGGRDEGEWTVQFDEPGTYRIDAIAFDEQGAYGDTVIWTVTVAEPEEIGGQLLSSETRAEQYTAGDTVETTVRVENTGNTEHTFYVGYAVRGPDGEWRDNDGTTHESVRLAAGETDRVTVAWQVPEDAPSGEYDTTTALYASQSADGLHDRLDRQDASNVFTVASPNAAPTVSRRTPEQEPTVDPDETVEFGIEATDRDGNLEGVEWYVDGNHEATTRLDGSADISDVARQFEEPGTYRIEAIAFDTEYQYSEAASWTVTVRAQSEIAAAIDAVDSPSGDYAPGDTVETTVYVKNTGDTANRFYVGYSVRGPDDQWRDNGGTTEESIWLSPGEREPVEVRYRLPDDPPRGEYDVWTTVYEQRQDGKLVGKLAEDRFADEFAVVDSAPTIRREAPSGEIERAIDTTTAFQVTAEDPNGDLAGVEWYVDGTFVSQSEASGTESKARWEGRFDQPGTYRIAAVAFDTERTYSRQATWTVTVTETASAELTRATVTDGPVSRTETTTSTVTVVNTGSTRQQFFVGYRLTGPDGETVARDGESGQTITLDSGERRRVSLEQTIPESATAGTHDGHIAVWAGTERGDPETALDAVSRSNAFSVSESPPIDASITDLAVESETVQTGETVQADVTIRNSGTNTHRYFVGYTVTGPEGTSFDNRDQTGRRLTLQPDTSETVTVSWEVPETASPGEYDALVAVWAEDSPDSLETKLDQQRLTDAFSVGSTGAAVLLRDQDGDPIDGARVTLYGPNRRSTNVSYQGRYSFTDLTPGQYVIYAAGPELKNDVTKRTELSGRQRVKISAVRSEPVAIRGRVLTTDGDPVEDARVKIRGEFKSVQRMTDGTGEFATDEQFRPGQSYTAEAIIDGRGYNITKVTPGQEGRRHTVTVPNAALASRVAEESGESWAQSDTVGDVLKYSSRSVVASTKAAIFDGYTPDRYSIPAAPETDIEYGDVCKDMHVTASTSCLAKTNEMRHRGSISQYGSFRGFGTGLMETVDSITSLPQALAAIWKSIRNLDKVYNGLKETTAFFYTHPEAFKRAVEQLPQAVTEKQQKQNPFPEGSDEYEHFAKAWYSGYLTFFASETVATGGAGKVVKGSKYVSRITESVDRAKGYLKTKRGRSETTARIRGRNVRPEAPEDIDGYDAIIRQTDAGEHFRERLTDRQLATFLSFQRTMGVPEDRLKAFVEVTGDSGAAFVAESFEKGDPEMVQWLFEIERYGDDDVDWGEWQADIAKKYHARKDDGPTRRPTGTDHDLFYDYIGTVNQVARHPELNDYDGYLDDVRTTEDYSYAGQLRRTTGEAETAVRYAREDDVEIELEKKLPDSDSDFDVVVTRSGGQREFVEVKTLNPTADFLEKNIYENLFEDTNAVNNKLKDTGEIDGTTTAELVIEPERYSREEIREKVTAQIRKHDGEVRFDHVQVRYSSRDTDIDRARITADGDVRWIDDTDNSQSLHPVAPEGPTTTAPSIGTISQRGAG